ncbi:hypothetical protein J1N35_022600 [Gossypium stocksii]|uniref:Retrotransposon Copia-like N-terminal domain-containing protein n=1 Tax=Gossypium stocksii TaxID=47602 RepID=A0A9D4A3M4_9ROSI|nr:hypothetical protein J1N35_022600 [Gossypium stocksii]
METEGVHVGDTPRHSSNIAGAVHSQGSGNMLLPNIHYFSKHDTIKLGEQNFLLWKHQILLILERDKFLASWLLSTVTDDVLVHLTTAKTSFDIWSIIERKFGAKSSISLSNMRHTLYSLKKAGLTVKEFG